MADQELTVTINAPQTGAAASIDNIDAALVALETSFKANTVATEALAAALNAGAAPALQRTQVATEGVATAQRANTIETRVATEAATGLSGAMDALATHYRVVAAGANVLGVETAGAAAKVAGFTEVIKGLESAAAPLLLALVAMQVAFSAFNFMKDAVTDAAALESQMASLGQAVKDRGGDWEHMSEGVEKFAQSQAVLGFASLPVISAMNKLVTAGASARDSQVEVMVAEEAARAKHMDLAEVVSMLTSVEAGRGMGLAKLDAKLAPLIRNHAKFSTILLQLAHDMSGQATAAANTYEGQVERLHAGWDNFAEGIGKVVIPALSGLMTDLLGFGQILGQVFDAVKNFSIGLVDGIAEGVHKAGNAIAWLRDQNIVHNKLASPEDRSLAAADLNRIASDKSNFDATVDHMKKSLADLSASMGAPVWDRGHKIVNDAMWEANHQREAALLRVVKNGLDFDPRAGGDPKAKADKTVSIDSKDFEPEKVDKYAEAQKRLEDALKRTDDAEGGLSERIKTSLTTEGEAAAQSAHDAQVAVDLIEKKHLLSAAIATETSQRAALTREYAAQASAAKQVASAYNAFENSAANDGSVEAGNRKADLADAFNKLDSAAKATAASIKTLTDNLRTNNNALGDVIKKLDEFKAKSEEAFASASRSWETHQKKVAEQLREDLDTANMSNAQKAVYYGNMLHGLESLDAEYRSRFLAADAAFQVARVSGDKQRVGTTMAALEAITQLYVDNEKLEEATDSKFRESEKAAWHDRVEAAKKAIDEEHKYETGFLDTILTKHQSLKDSLKSIWSEMATDYIKAIEQMMVKSALFASLNETVLPNLMKSMGLSAAVGLGAMGLGTNAPAIGPNSNGPGAASIDSVAGLRIAPGNGIPINVVQLAGSTIPAASFGVPGATIDGAGGSAIAGSGMDVWGNPIKSGGATLGGSALAGLLIGSAVGSGSPTSMLGGALGGVIAAALHANPLIGAGIDVASSLLGGLFGPHETAAQTPDINDPNWSATETNWNGAAAMFNGSFVQPGAQYNTSNGGQSLSGSIAAWMQSVKGNLAGLTPAQQALYQQILTGIDAGNPNATAAQTGIASEGQGNVTFTDGSKMSVSAFEQLVASFQTTVGSGPQSSGVFQITRAYPTFNAQMAADGTYTQTPITVVPGQPAPAASPAAASPAAGIGNGIGNGDVKVSVTVQGSVIGVTPDDLANAIAPAVATALGRRSIGITPGSPTSYGSPGSRFTGNT